MCRAACKNMKEKWLYAVALLYLQKQPFTRESLVTMDLDLQPDGLTAGLAGHCQLDKKYP